MDEELLGLVAGLEVVDDVSDGGFGLEEGVLDRCL
jgi:hypothetical protein